VLNVNEIVFNFSDIKHVLNFSFARNTTIGIGGKAPIAFYPKNQNELYKIICYFSKNNIKYTVLGQGANTLVSDNGFNGVVICTKYLNNLYNTPDGKVYVECGVTAEKLVKFCEEKSLSGTEFLAGIPATVGGLCYMNAGANNVYIETIINSIKVIKDCEIFDISKQNCKYSYKSSIFQTDNYFIVGCELLLKAGNRTEISAKIRERRFAREKLPKGRSLGCVFKNPNTFSAGELIDFCGWKGFSLGNAYISQEHANFIINKGGASSVDFLNLVSLIEKDVLAKKGVKLQREFCYIGE